MSDNKAAWLMEKCGHPFNIAEAPMPEPTEHEVTIRTHAVAFAPVDYAIQAYGMIVEEFPAILGCDAAGEVTAIGSAVTNVEIGDRVLGMVDHGFASGVDNRGKGTYQLFCNIKNSFVAKLPQSVDYKDACVLPLGICTAAGSLFHERCLALPHPQLEPKPTGKIVLVWGGSSSVGSCGVQLAKAAGLEVAATCSARNFDYCRSIGADYVFDYNSESIVDDVVAALKGKDFAGVFDAIIDPQTYIKGAEIAHQLGGKQMVATVLPTAMSYEEPLPHGVKIACTEGTFDEVAEPVWSEWITGALANGTLKCKPDAHVVGRGLEKIQEANDIRKNPVSASKPVVELP